MKHQNCKIEVKTQCLDFASGNTSKSQFIKKRKIVSGTKLFFFVLREREMGNDSAEKCAGVTVLQTAFWISLHCFGYAKVTSWLHVVYLSGDEENSLHRPGIASGGKFWLLGLSWLVGWLCGCRRTGCSCAEGPPLRNVLLTKVCQSPGASCISGVMEDTALCWELFFWHPCKPGRCVDISL